MGFEIGQWRYSGAGCMNRLNATASYKATAMSTSAEEDTSSFQDIKIQMDGGNFIKGRDYYLKMMIPQDMNYAMSFDISIVQDSGNVNDTFQFIRNVTIEKGGSSSTAYRVVLYEKSDGEVAAMIPEPYIEGNPNEKDIIYYDETTDRYYLGLGGTKYKPADKYNDLFVIASWAEELGEFYGVFEITFRPVDDNFAYIYLQMIRTAQDYNIQRLKDDGTMEFGRKVDLESMKYELYAVNDLLPQMTSTGRLSRIGVWGRPGLIMVINGEEIHIGPSGFYEEDLLPIETFGVVAPDNDYSSFFTVDYEFNNEIVV